MEQIDNAEVAAVIGSWQKAVQRKVLYLRHLIYDVATQTANVGEIEETLKWNVPAYLTSKPKSGTTIRLESKGVSGKYGLYVPCSTILIEQCKELYPDVFSFDKNRGLIFGPDEVLPENELRHFIAMALTYHVKSSPNTKLSSHKGLRRK